MSFSWATSSTPRSKCGYTSFTMEFTNNVQQRSFVFGLSGIFVQSIFCCTGICTYVPLPSCEDKYPIAINSEMARSKVVRDTFSDFANAIRLGNRVPGRISWIRFSNSCFAIFVFNVSSKFVLQILIYAVLSGEFIITLALEIVNAYAIFAVIKFVVESVIHLLLHLADCVGRFDLPLAKCTNQ